MRKILLPLLFICLNTSAQNSYLYSLFLGSNVNGSYPGNASYDPVAHKWTLLNEWSNPDIHAFGDHTLDPVNNRFYQVIGDSVHMYLLNVDVATGNLATNLFQVDSVGSGAPGTVTIGGNIGGTVYNCTDNCVYFTHYKAPWEDSIHLAKVNVASYEVTELAKFPIGYYAIDNSLFPSAQYYYLLYFDYWANTSKVITFNTQTETYTSVNVSLPGFNATELNLTYNPNDGNLYGIDFDLDSFAYNNYLADLRIVKLSPVTGVLTFLCPDYLGNLVGGNMALYPPTNKMYFMVLPSNPGYIDLGIADISTNTITYESPVYTNAGNSYPTLFGGDIFNLAKDCPLATGVEEVAANVDCDFMVTQNFSESAINVFSACNNFGNENLEFELYDLLGRKILTHHLEGITNEIHTNINSNAIYVYRIMNGNEKVASGKLLFSK